jgi:uncharacterized protein (DUF4415 family)
MNPRSSRQSRLSQALAIAAEALMNNAGKAGLWWSLTPNEDQTQSESFHYERRIAVKKISSKTRSKTNWTRVDSLSDRDIDYSDIPELDKDFFKSATLVLPEPKTTVTIRLDQQVLEWFKAKGPGYQTRINALLRAYMEEHKA